MLVMRGIALVSVVACTSCILDRNRMERPARLQLGMNGRSLGEAPAPAAQPAALGSTVSPEASSTQRLEAVTASAQFTMALQHNFYAGGEIEAGMLETRGSNVAGAYGVFGFQTNASFGALAVEMTAGWRTMRYTLNAEDVDSVVAEPRLRGDLWISEQFTLGAALGTSLGDGNGFMAGVYLGVHSQPRR